MSGLIGALDESADEGVSGDVIDIYNEIMLLAPAHPEMAISLAATAVDFFVQRHLPWPLCLFRELSVRCLMNTGLVHDGCKQLEVLAVEVRDDDQRSSLLELTDDAMNAAFAASSSDITPIILATLTRIYAKLEEKDRLVRAFLGAAGIYSTLGAKQPAYRCLVDAESIAQDMESLPLLAEVYADVAAVMFELQDMASSAEAGKMCLAIHQQLETKPLPGVVLNLATAQMHIGDVASAARDFRDFLRSEPAIEPSHSRAATMNLAACLRQQRDFPGAREAYAQAGKQMNDDCLPEERLEFELIGALLHAELAEWSLAIDHLQCAARALELRLQRVHRLHHRRGLRERFISRLGTVLGLLPATGCTTDVLTPLAAVYGGILSDWLSVLDWEQELSKSASLTDQEKDEVTATIHAVRTFGAPFLVGFREKYDDPWSSSPQRQPWDKLADLADRLADRGYGRPTKNAELDCAVANLSNQLAAGYCILALTYGGAGGHLWCLKNGSYRKMSVDLNVLGSWKSAQRAFNLEQIERQSFISALKLVQEYAGELLTPIFDELGPECPGLIYLQDFSDALPIMSLTLGHAELRQRMWQGTFEVRTVPAIYNGRQHIPFTDPTILSVIDSSAGLGLAEHEAQVASMILNSPRLAQIEADQDDGDVEKFSDADILIVSTHGVPISLFVDPYLGNLGGVENSHCIGVDQIQRNFHAFRYRLVLLNSCNSAVSTSRNSQQQFRTHDAASYPAVLLLNRKSVVGGALWKISDTISYLHTVLTAEGLEEGLSPARALSRSAARIGQLPTADAIGLLSLAPDSQTRSERIPWLQSLPTGALGHPYFSAGFSIYTLL